MDELGPAPPQHASQQAATERTNKNNAKKKRIRWAERTASRARLALRRTAAEAVAAVGHDAGGQKLKGHVAIPAVVARARVRVCARAHRPPCEQYAQNQKTTPVARIGTVAGSLVRAPSGPVSMLGGVLVIGPHGTP